MPIVRLINPTSYASSGARSPRDGRAGYERITAEKGGIDMARRRFRLRRSRRSRNPFGASMSETASLAAWALAGGIGTATLPAMFLKEKNTGAMGYAGNAASAFALSWLADRFAGPRAAQGAMVGGVLMIMGRAIQDFMGKNLLSFGQLGMYTNTWFYPPGTSTGLLQNQVPPLPPAAAASGTGAAMAGLLGRGARMRSRYAR